MEPSMYARFRTLFFNQNIHLKKYLTINIKLIYNVKLIRNQDIISQMDTSICIEWVLPSSPHKLSERANSTYYQRMIRKRYDKDNNV